MREKTVQVKGTGKAIASPLVQVHLVVTRQTGDTERYKLAELPDLRYAWKYRQALAKVKVPTTLGAEWKRTA